MDQIRGEVPNTLFVDIGCMAPSAPGGRELKTEVTVRVLEKLGAQALGLAGRDFMVGADNLKAWTQDGPPLVATNLVEKSTGKHWANEMVMTSMGDKSVAVLSVMPGKAFDRQELAEAKKRFVILDPKTAVDAALAKLDKKPDLVVLLSQLRYKDTVLTAMTTPMVDLAICPFYKFKKRQLADGRPYVVTVADNAKALGSLYLDFAENGTLLPTRKWSHYLGDKVPEDKAIATYVNGRLGSLAKDAQMNRSDSLVRGAGLDYLLTD